MNTLTLGGIGRVYSGKIYSGEMSLPKKKKMFQNCSC